MFPNPTLKCNLPFLVSVLITYKLVTGRWSLLRSINGALAGMVGDPGLLLSCHVVPICPMFL